MMGSGTLRVPYGKTMPPLLPSLATLIGTEAEMRGIPALQVDQKPAIPSGGSSATKAFEGESATIPGIVPLSRHADKGPIKIAIP